MSEVNLRCCSSLTGTWGLLIMVGWPMNPRGPPPFTFQYWDYKLGPINISRFLYEELNSGFCPVWQAFYCLSHLPSSVSCVLKHSLTRLYGTEVCTAQHVPMGLEQCLEHRKEQQLRICLKSRPERYLYLYSYHSLTHPLHALQSIGKT